MMKIKNLFMGTLVAASLMTTTAAMAHRVNVFAWVDGDEVHTESKFSGGTLVRSGGITVKDEKTGAVVNQGTTNDKGEYSFRLPEGFAKTGHGLVVEISAGEGHRNTWTVQPDEISADASAAAEATNAPAAPAAAPAAPAVQTAAAAATATTAAPAGALTRAEVEEIVDKALQRQLNPMKRTLAEALDPSIKVSDVVGGIGWIFGLFGVAAIFSNRRRGREDAGKKEA